MYKNFQCRNVQEMQRSIVKHCTPRSQIMWNVTLNSSYTSSYIINVDQNKKRKQSPRMRRRDCNLPLKYVKLFLVLTWLLLNDPILYVVLGHVTRTRFCFYANLKGDRFRDVYRIFKTEIRTEIETANLK